MEKIDKTLKKIIMNYLNKTLAAAAMLMAAATLFSCQKGAEEDTPSTVTVDKELVARGVETDMQSAVINVPVKCDGEWHVTVTQSKPHWLRIEGSTITKDRHLPTVAARPSPTKVWAPPLPTTMP